LIVFIFVLSVIIDLLPGKLREKYKEKYEDKEKNKVKIEYDIVDNFGLFFFKRILYYFSLPVLITFIAQIALKDFNKFISVINSFF